MEDEAFALKLRTALEVAIAQGAEPIRHESLAARPWVDRLLSWIAIGLARIASGIIGTSQLENR